MLKSQLACVLEMLWRSWAKNLQSPLNSSSCRYCSLCTAAKVRIVKIGKAVGHSPDLASVSQVLPLSNLLSAAHLFEDLGDALTVANHNAVDISYFTRLGCNT